jgi:hypothetical protein
VAPMNVGWFGREEAAGINFGEAFLQGQKLTTWEPVAAAGATQDDRRLVVDQLAAEAGKDGRFYPTGVSASPPLLLTIGGEIRESRPAGR